MLLREQGDVKSRWITASINTFAQYALENGFKFGAQFEADNKDNRNLDFQPAYAFYDEVVSPTVAKVSNVRTNSTDSRRTDFNFDAQLTAEYEHTYGNHLVHLLGGYEQRQSQTDQVNAGIQ
jgi:hypothetical protein